MIIILTTLYFGDLQNEGCKSESLCLGKDEDRRPGGFIPWPTKICQAPSKQECGVCL